MLLEAHRAKKEQGPKGLSETRRSLEAKDSAKGTLALSAYFEKKDILASLFPCI